MIHHRLAVVSLQEVPSTRPRHDAGLWVGEVALGLVFGNARMLFPLSLGRLSGGLGRGFQRRHGLADLLQPALPKGQLLRQLITALKSEMVRKSGVLFAASTRKAMSSWSRRVIRREDGTPTQ